MKYGKEEKVKIYKVSWRKYRERDNVKRKQNISVSE